MPAARASRAVAGNFVPPRAVFRARPRRVPRTAPEHGRFPMEAAARIASMNFAIAYTLIDFPIKVMAGVLGVVEHAFSVLAFWLRSGCVLGIVQLGKQALCASGARGRTRDGIGGAAAPPNSPARKKFSILDLFPEGASGVFLGARGCF